MKGCLGCGCFTILAMGLLAVLFGGYLWWQGPELVEGVTESVAVLGGGSGSSGGGGMNLSSLAGGGGGEEPSLERLMKADGDDSSPGAVSSSAQRDRLSKSDDFFDSLDTPMTRRDINNVNASLKEWDDSRTIKRFNSLLEQGEELKDDESLMANARKIRLAIGLAFRVRDISQEFPKHVEKSGGDAFLQDYTQILAIHRASQIGATGDHEPWEQAVADALLKDHDENREDFEKNRALLRQAAQDESLDISQLSEEEQGELMEAFAKQFSYLTSAISRDSLENWAALSDEERKEFADHFSSPQGYLSRTIGMLGMENASEELILMNFMGL